MRRPPGSGPLLRTPDELDDPGTTQERLVRLERSRVLFADHALLQHDFPRLRDARLLQTNPALAELEPSAQRDALDGVRTDWLLHQAGWISAPQAVQSRVNTPIPHTRQTRAAWRPPRYGRAAVVQTDDGPGLLDLKGVGVARGRHPQLRRYQTGLCSLPELIRGVLMAWTIDRIFQAAAPEFRAMPIYGLLDPGFRLLRPVGRKEIPAAVLVRRAHRRPKGGVELPRQGSRHEYLKFELEMLLRSYGLTSTNEGTRLEVDRHQGAVRVRYAGDRMDLSPKELDELLQRVGPLPVAFDGVNIQLTREVEQPGARAVVVDFGHFQVATHFELPVASLVRDRRVRWGGALRPGDAGFVQPDPVLRLPDHVWSKPAHRAVVSAICDDIVAGGLHGRALVRRLERVLADTDAHWRRPVAETA